MGFKEVALFGNKVGTFGESVGRNEILLVGVSVGRNTGGKVGGFCIVNGEIELLTLGDVDKFGLGICVGSKGGNAIGLDIDGIVGAKVVTSGEIVGYAVNGLGDSFGGEVGNEPSVTGETIGLIIGGCTGDNVVGLATGCSLGGKVGDFVGVLGDNGLIVFGNFTGRSVGRDDIGDVVGSKVKGTTGIETGVRNGVIDGFKEFSGIGGLTGCPNGRTTGGIIGARDTAGKLGATVGSSELLTFGKVTGGDIVGM